MVWSLQWRQIEPELKWKVVKKLMLSARLLKKGKQQLKILKTVNQSSPRWKPVK